MNPTSRLRIRARSLAFSSSTCLPFSSNVRIAGLIFTWRETTSNPRTDADQLEIVRGHSCQRYLFSSITSLESNVFDSATSETGKQRVSFSPIQKIWRGNVAVGHRRLPVRVQPDKLLRLRARAVIGASQN